MTGDLTYYHNQDYCADWKPTDRYTLSINIQQSTECNRDCFFNQLNLLNANEFERVRTIIKSEVDDKDLKHRAVGVVDDVDFLTNMLGISFELPKMLLDVCDDEVYIEWIFTHFRIGILIHENRENDAWFILYDATKNNEESKGCTDLRSLIQPIQAVKMYGNES